MRTSLKYSVFKEEEYDYDKGKLVSRIKCRRRERKSYRRLFAETWTCD